MPASIPTVSPIPTWLDPTAEITDPGQPLSINSKLDKIAMFINMCLSTLHNVDKTLTSEQCVWLTANFVVETGWGVKRWKGNNLGGWKINQTYANEVFTKTGKPAKWWQAPGHIEAGDPPVCYYRGYDSINAFFKEWLERFVPKPPIINTSHRYKLTGELFWSHNPNWFSAMVKAGYKGSVTQQNPDPTVTAWKQVCYGVMTRFVQKTLGVKPDGKWGAQSKATAIAKGLNPDLGIEHLFNSLLARDKQALPPGNV